jgi:hypothetical protein
VAGGLFNTSRQIGGALAIAVFGALIAAPGGFLHGYRLSLQLGAAVAGLALLVVIGGRAHIRTGSGR